MGAPRAGLSGGQESSGAHGMHNDIDGFTGNAYWVRITCFFVKKEQDGASHCQGRGREDGQSCQKS